MAGVLLGCAQLAQADDWPGPDGGGAAGGTSALEVAWSKRFGDAQDQYARAVAFDADGGVFLAGQFQGAIDLHQPPLQSQAGFDAFVAQFGGGGDWVWERGLGDARPAGDQNVGDIAVDPRDGHVVVAGTFDGSIDFGSPPMSAGDVDGFLGRFAPDSSRGWGKSFGGALFDGSFGVAVSEADGDIVLTGDAHPGVDFGGGPLLSGSEAAAFLAIFDSTGAHRSSWLVEGTGIQSGSSVAFGQDGSVYMAGSFIGSPDFGCREPIASATKETALVAKYDSNLACLWVRVLGPALEPDFEMDVDSEGDALIAASFEGSLELGGRQYQASGSDGLVVKLAAETGDVVWITTLGGEGDQNPNAVAVDAGEILVTGSFQRELRFENGEPRTTTADDAVFVARFDSAGAHLWSAAYGDAAHQAGTAIAGDDNGGVVVAGEFTGSLDFGNGVLQSAGQVDVFLVKLVAAK